MTQRLCNCLIYFLYFCITWGICASVNLGCICINQQPHGWLVRLVYLWFHKPTLQRPIAWKSHGPNCTPYKYKYKYKHKYKYKYVYVFSSKVWNHPIRRMEFTICKLYSSAAESQIEMHLFLKFSTQLLLFTPSAHKFILKYRNKYKYEYKHKYTNSLRRASRNEG